MDLIEAVISNDTDTVKKLLSQGEDPDFCFDNEANITPLHFAAQENALEIAKLLIAAGANVHAETEPDGETPLDIARIHQSEGIIDLLVAYVKPSYELH